MRLAGTAAVISASRLEGGPRGVCRGEGRLSGSPCGGSAGPVFCRHGPICRRRFARWANKSSRCVQKLPIQHRDQELIAATAYPPPGSTDVEVFYNRVGSVLLVLGGEPGGNALLVVGRRARATADVLAGRRAAAGCAKRLPRLAWGCAVTSPAGAADRNVRNGSFRRLVRGAVGPVVRLAAALVAAVGRPAGGPRPHGPRAAAAAVRRGGGTW